jgi:hypothetical protein
MTNPERVRSLVERFVAKFYFVFLQFQDGGKRKLALPITDC